MKTSKILSNALALMLEQTCSVQKTSNKHYNKGICCYVYMSSLNYNNEIKYGKVSKLMNHIDGLIRGHEFVIGWLIKEGVPPDSITEETLFEYRIAWLKKLIKDYRSIGD
jgi:hypothetical protein